MRRVTTCRPYLGTNTGLTGQVPTQISIIFLLSFNGNKQHVHTVFPDGDDTFRIGNHVQWISRWRRSMPPCSRTIQINRGNIHMDDLLVCPCILLVFLRPLEEERPFRLTQMSTLNQGWNNLICQRSLMTMCQTNVKQDKGNDAYSKWERVRHVTLYYFLAVQQDNFLWKLLLEAFLEAAFSYN